MQIPTTYRLGNTSITKIPEKLISGFDLQKLFPSWKFAIAFSFPLGFRVPRPVISLDVKNPGFV